MVPGESRKEVRETMAAMLTQDLTDGKRIESGLPHNERCCCSRRGCGSAYTLSYSDGEYHMLGGSEHNVARMRRLALEVIEINHPDHSVRTYLWKAISQGLGCHWVAADSAEARATL